MATASAKRTAASLRERSPTTLTLQYTLPIRNVVVQDVALSGPTSSKYFQCETTSQYTSLS
ncbi:MAG: hypothetical protein AAGM36_14275 [Cyanobacteria bacterium J06597_1]